MMIEIKETRAHEGGKERKENTEFGGTVGAYYYPRTRTLLKYKLLQSRAIKESGIEVHEGRRTGK